MEKQPNILDAIKDFVERPRKQDVSDRVAKFLKRASAKGDVVKSPVIESQPVGRRSKQEEALMDFFAPVGHRGLFEQEILFLMNEGVGYLDIMRMPIYLRKKLIEQKIGDKGGEAADAADPLFSQWKASQEAMGDPEPTNADRVRQ